VHQVCEPAGRPGDGLVVWEVVGEIHLVVVGAHPQGVVVQPDGIVVTPHPRTVASGRATTRLLKGECSRRRHTKYIRRPEDIHAIVPALRVRFRCVGRTSVLA
jgi:hypothetical protein